MPPLGLVVAGLDKSINGREGSSQVCENLAHELEFTCQTVVIQYRTSQIRPHMCTCHVPQLDLRNDGGGFVWVQADSFLRCVASPCHSFVTMVGDCCAGAVHGCCAGWCYVTALAMVPGAWSVSCADWRSFVLTVGVPCLVLLGGARRLELSPCNTCHVGLHQPPFRCLQPRAQI